jgi:acetyltransferase-like isoleucine patch superfamily enzyme
MMGGPAIWRWLRRGRHGLADLIGGMIAPTPGRAGSTLRVVYFRARGAKLGKRVRIDPLVQIDRPDLVCIGDDTWIDRNAILIAGEPREGRETRYVGDVDRIQPGRIQIGQRCHVGPFAILSGLGGLYAADDVTLSAGTKVYSLSHHYRSWSRPEDATVVFGSMGSDANQAMLQGAVVLERNVGTGADVLILPGTTIGERTFVRPRSVVRGRWPRGSILGGDPAHREGDRFIADTVKDGA